ncbi:MAG: DEAD/DEAH box helicase family protein [Lachnospiraceae bacterium]|nr:DEAD/DEAH box helicase family protein [Lachnospiraceae bacterium]
MANSEQMIKKKLRVGDIISNQQIEQWKDGDVITISAGTGAGKSYFIKNILFSYAKDEGKKILMLIHRTNCVDQFKAEIRRDGKEKYIDIMTYQAIETRELYHYGLDMSQYKYIVCDEFHYFIGDASFNKTTDISFENIMKQTHATRIFMSV